MLYWGEKEREVTHTHVQSERKRGVQQTPPLKAGASVTTPIIISHTHTHSHNFLVKRQRSVHSIVRLFLPQSSSNKQQQTTMTVLPRRNTSSTSSSIYSTSATCVTVVAAILVILSAPNAIVVKVVEALPTGAAGCAGGQPAVGGPHMLAPPAFLNIMQAGYTITIDDEPLVPGIIPVVSAGETHTITVEGPTPFRGVLMRGQSFDGSLLEMETSQDGLSAAAACGCDSMTQDCVAPVVGITHTSRDDKTVASVTVLSETVGQAGIDITIVQLLNLQDQTSIYMYEGFPIEFIEDDGGGDDDVTDAPVGAAVTDAPVGAPVGAAVTDAPVGDVTDAPIAAPITDAPVTDAPVDAPIYDSPVAPAYNTDVPSDYPSLVPSTRPSIGDGGEGVSDSDAPSYVPTVDTTGAAPATTSSSPSPVVVPPAPTPTANAVMPPSDAISVAVSLTAACYIAVATATVAMVVVVV
jgi:hypothetical protein